MCLRSKAETMFKRADWNNGVEGWRRLVRQIDHGKAIRLETLRRQVQELHIRPIKSFDDVAEGVAKFENVMADYARAGGVQAPDVQLKADLLRILPREMRELFMWHSIDMDISFARFRDTVVAQTAMVIMNRGGGKYINVMEGQHNGEGSPTKDGEDEGGYTPEENAGREQELLAEFRRSKGAGTGCVRRAKGGGKGRPAAADDR